MKTPLPTSMHATYALGMSVGVSMAAVVLTGFHVLAEKVSPDDATLPRSDDARALLGYTALFAVHLVNAIVDSRTGAHTDLRRWINTDGRPRAKDYRWFFAVHHAFWVVCHSYLAAWGTYFYWTSVRAGQGGGDAEGDVHDDIQGGYQEVSSLLPMPLRRVCSHIGYGGLVAVVALGFAHIARFGVSQKIDDDAPTDRRGLGRLTDNPLFALLCFISLCEAATRIGSETLWGGRTVIAGGGGGGGGGGRGGATGDERAAVWVVQASVAIPLVIALWIIIGGTHQNRRFQRRWIRWEAWTLTSAKAALYELCLPLTPTVVVAVSCGTGLFVLMGGYPAIIAAGNVINVATALGFSCMVVAAVWSAK